MGPCSHSPEGNKLDFLKCKPSEMESISRVDIYFRVMSLPKYRKKDPRVLNMFLLELFYTLMSLFPSNFKSDEVNRTHLSLLLSLKTSTLNARKLEKMVSVLQDGGFSTGSVTA